MPATSKAHDATKVNRIPYKDYLVQATPYKLADSGEWTINISIWHDTGSQVNIRNFSAANTFKTKEVAIQHCINFGRQVIDGKFKNCTVSDL